MIPHNNNMFQRLLLSTTHIVSDGTNLLLAVIKRAQRGGNSSDIRDVLLSAAKEHRNRVATSVLNADRELGLFRYYGLYEYVRKKNVPWIETLRQKTFSLRSTTAATLTTTTTATSSTITDDNGNNENKERKNSKKVAKVAFMITSLQRSRLFAMGYAPEFVKRLKPIEALLILEHDLSPESVLKTEDNEENVLERLVRENAEMQQREREAALLNTTSGDNGKLSDSVSSAHPSMSSSSSISDDINTQQHLLLQSEQEDTNTFSEKKEHSNDVVSAESLLSTSSSQTDDQSKSGNNDFFDGWFEVVQIESNSSTPPTVIGLYRDKKEAEMCCENKQILAKKREEKSIRNGKAISFIVRRKESS